MTNVKYIRSGVFFTVYCHFTNALCQKKTANVISRLRLRWFIFNLFDLDLLASVNIDDDDDDDGKLLLVLKSMINLKVSDTIDFIPNRINAHLRDTSNFFKFFFLSSQISIKIVFSHQEWLVPGPLKFSNSVHFTEFSFLFK